MTTEIERVRALCERIPDATGAMFEISDVRAVLARLAEVEAERDAAKTEEESWFAAAHQREEETWKAEAERDQLRAELEAARPVVEAAAAYREARYTAGAGAAGDRLVAAVDLYRSATTRNLDSALPDPSLDAETLPTTEEKP